MAAGADVWGAHTTATAAARETENPALAQAARVFESFLLFPIQAQKFLVMPLIH